MEPSSGTIGPMEQRPGPAIPLITAVTLVVVTLYSWAGYTMVASFSVANPAYPGHARAAAIWSVTGVLAAIGAIGCAIIAWRRMRRRDRE
jgi:hypothetical protein